ncbi:Leucine Rich Repeat family protein [Histomonas meleagridis]|uniref:Leucine Rich Repeat family protein n=1 Tax=Histomonas meleagridis TaxID=135588 RepID=UPI003559DCA6|nr:Leucine Rich Repeat family protein [Histomonas meleagridis]KAH0804532.1 Leucine Rich Repeat family protein [Histomonas meleagridis]
MSVSSKSSFSLIRDGVLDLSDQNIVDSDLGRIGILPNLQVLNISNTNIENFSYLRPQPNLAIINAENCPIHYLNGLSEQKSLKELNIENSPLSQENNFKYLALATVGPQLLVLNHTKLTRQDQQIAEIMAKRKSNNLFLKTEEEETHEQEDPNDTKLESSAVLETIYFKEHRSEFAPFAHNEAVLYDLRSFGPLHPIDDISTDQDVWRATRDLRRRNEALRNLIKEKCNELHIDCVFEN